MFDERRKLRKLRKKIALLEEEEFSLRAGRDIGEHPDDVPAKVEQYGRNAIIINLNHLSIQLAELETNRLVRKAQRLGIEIPRTDNWWWEDEKVAEVINGEYHGKYYLSDIGKAGVSKLIRDEKRKSIEWWIKTVIVPLLTVLISALGLIVALVSISKK
jgi:hypothetical protein